MHSEWITHETVYIAQTYDYGTVNIAQLVS